MATLTCPMPQNINPLSPNGFRFTISKIPEVEFFCQEVNLPEINLGAAEQANPFVDVPVPGEKLTFGELNLQFIVDEEMANYLSIHNWLIALGFPQSYQQYTSYMKNQDGLTDLVKNHSDGLLQILNNTNNAIKIVRFADMFPTSLASLTFLSTSQDVQYLIGNATFRYTYYEFVTDSI